MGGTDRLGGKRSAIKKAARTFVDGPEVEGTEASAPIRENFEAGFAGFFFALPSRKSNHKNRPGTTMDAPAKIKFESSLFLRRTAGPITMEIETDHFKPLKKRDLLYLRSGDEPFRALHRYFVIGVDSYCGFGKLSASRLNTFQFELDLEGKYLGIPGVEAKIIMRNVNYKLFAPAQIALVTLCLPDFSVPVAVIKVFQASLAQDLITIRFECEVTAGMGLLEKSIAQAFSDGTASTDLTRMVFEPFKYARNNSGSGASSFLALHFVRNERTWNQGHYDLRVFECGSAQVMTITPRRC